MLEGLAKKIWSNTDFKSDYEKLVRNAVASDLGSLDSGLTDFFKENMPESELYPKLARAASIFSHVDNSTYKDAAYRIAVSLLEYGENDGYRAAGKLILEKLGNFPAINFAFNNYHGLNNFNLRSAALYLNHVDENSIYIDNQKSILTNFQKKLWDLLIEGRNVAVSAPTSAGKSYVVQKYLAKEVMDGKASVVCYVVPSRALINQVSSDLSQTFSELGVKDNIEIVSVPNPRATYGESESVTIFVLTQERLHLLLDNDKELDFDILVVDEAQNFADGGRGVLLYSAVSRVLMQSSMAQCVFVCPFADIENSIGSFYPELEMKILTETDGAVAQNLIKVRAVKEPGSNVDLFLLNAGEEDFIGRKKLNHEILGNNFTAVFAKELSGDEANLIYAGGPARCEDIAAMLNQIPIEDGDAELEELSEFVSNSIHPKFPLAGTIRSRIGYHYGRIPSLVRKEVEKAFSSGTLKYLVTTSTLLHGVNLPAKNLFIDKPIKGMGEFLSGPEFWNLVGRAGRLGKEFEGNIFLVGSDKWAIDLTKSDKKYEVKNVLGEQLTGNFDDFVSFLSDGDAKTGMKGFDAIENTSSKVFLDYLNGNLEKTLMSFPEPISDKSKDYLYSVLDRIGPAVNLKAETISRNPTISVLIQQRLKEYFLSTIKKKGVDRVMPLHPLTGGDKVHDNYLWVFKRIHTHLEGRPAKDRSQFYFVPLARKWMRGEPLPLIIDQAISYKKNSSGDVNIPSVIRETLKDIELNLRFRYVKYLSCYTSVLADALHDLGMSEAVESIPNLGLYMEMGASSPSMLSLLELGLSRITASNVVDKMVNKNLDLQGVKNWMRRTDLESLGIPGPSVREMLSVNF